MGQVSPALLPPEAPVGAGQSGCACVCERACVPVGRSLSWSPGSKPPRIPWVHGTWIWVPEVSPESPHLLLRVVEGAGTESLHPVPKLSSATDIIRVTEVAEPQLPPL